jgi:ribonuclease P protein component
VLFYLPHTHFRKVGFTATKKIGNAVKRNKAKRRLRALFLSYESQLKNGQYIFVAKEGIDSVEFTKLQKDFFKILRNAHALKK